MTTTNEKNIATITHLSALTQYIIPFGNYIFPIIIWSSKKNESEFVDKNGKNVLNFQLSMLTYTLIVALIAIPTFIYSIFKNIPKNALINDCEMYFENFDITNIAGLAILGFVLVALFIFLKIIEFILIIYASVKASNGEAYKYPLTINFLK